MSPAARLRPRKLHNSWAAAMLFPWLLPWTIGKGGRAWTSAGGTPRRGRSARRASGCRASSRVLDCLARERLRVGDERQRHGVAHSLQKGRPVLETGGWWWWRRDSMRARAVREWRALRILSARTLAASCAYAWDAFAQLSARAAT